MRMVNVLLQIFAWLHEQEISINKKQKRNTRFVNTYTRWTMNTSGGVSFHMTDGVWLSAAC